VFVVGGSLIPALPFVEQWGVSNGIPVPKLVAATILAALVICSFVSLFQPHQVSEDRVEATCISVVPSPNVTP
jgi:hypothetical protein